MNTNKILLGGLAGAVTLFILKWVVYGVLLTDWITVNLNPCILRPMQEYIIWAMILAALQLLGRKTIDLMRTNQIGDFEVWERKSKFGLGFELITEKSTSICPGSVGSFGWGGAFTTWYLVDPSEDLIMLLYINIDQSDFDILEKLNILVYQALIDKK